MKMKNETYTQNAVAAIKAYKHIAICYMKFFCSFLGSTVCICDNAKQRVQKNQNHDNITYVYRMVTVRGISKWHITHTPAPEHTIANLFTSDRRRQQQQQ